MGCINKSSKIIIHSMESFKKETKIKLEKIKNEDPIDKILSFLEEKNESISHSNSEQSQIPIKAKIESNEFIFL